MRAPKIKFGILLFITAIVAFNLAVAAERLTEFPRQGGNFDGELWTTYADGSSEVDRSQTREASRGELRADQIFERFGPMPGVLVEVWWPVALSVIVTSLIGVAWCVIRAATCVPSKTYQNSD